MPIHNLAPTDQNALHLAVQHGWDASDMIRRAVANFDYENSPDYQGD